MKSCITPSELKAIVDRQRQVDSAWTEKQILEAIMSIPLATPQRRFRIKQTGRKPKKEQYLTRSQHRELARGSLPKGVNWTTVRLSPKQQALVKIIGRRTRRAKEESFSLAYAS